MKLNFKTTVIILLSLGLLTKTLHSEEIAAYQNKNPTSLKPKVLIILDSSSMMETTNVLFQDEAYDPAISYKAVSNDRPLNRLYFSTTNANHYIAVDKNRCAESIVPLTKEGMFSSKSKKWHSYYKTYTEIDDSSYTRKTLYMDCEADVLASNPNNPGLPSILVGYPSDSSNSPYEPNKSNVFWGNQAITWYSANYVNYVNSITSTPHSKTPLSKLDVAKSSLSALISSNTAVDFGLVIFNKNASPKNNGGRVIHRLIENMTGSTMQTSSINDRANIKAIINAIKPNSLNSLSYSPLCETFYESFRYLAGETVKYGLNRDPNELPKRDLLAESKGRYKSPTTGCQNTYIVIISGGNPSLDTDVNGTIESLTGKVCSSYASGLNVTTKNCSPELAEFMANFDLDLDPSNGQQNAYTYTLGFGTNIKGQALLKTTALKGMGIYQPATNALELQSALTIILSHISSDYAEKSSFNKAAIHLKASFEGKNAFIAQYQPTATSRWKGNIKGFNLIENSQGELEYFDKNNNLAIDPISGQIKPKAMTLWNTQAIGDGGKIDQGGVGQLLADRNPYSRNIYTNTGATLSNSKIMLEDFIPANIDRNAFGLQSDQLLFEIFGVNNQQELNSLINWARGVDVDDEDKNGLLNEARPWILEDIIHSQPLIINYGARQGYSKMQPDRRMIVGTNGGFLHMFGLDDGQEDWAFFPKQLSQLLQIKRTNQQTPQHHYGIDASVVSYLDDGGDGIINQQQSSDKAWLFFGLRRGGHHLYGLDVTAPNSPSLLWHIQGGQGLFAELGQTWSEPVVTTIAGHNDSNGLAKPVLIFGAGYDSQKDSKGIAKLDNVGRGIFIVDAETGSLVWSLTPAANTVSNQKNSNKFDTMLHSVPSNLTLVDSNSDGLTDRLYFGDTGGHLWRVDMPGQNLPSSAQNTWSFTKLATLSTAKANEDRRFFKAPDIIQTKGLICHQVIAGQCQGAPKITNYDAIVLGSGDITDPNAIDVNNQFFMIRDLQTQAYVNQRLGYKNSVGSTCSIGAQDFRCQLPLTTSDLFNATNQQSPPSANLMGLNNAALQNSSGWCFDLAKIGEKITSTSITVQDEVFFTTYSPSPNSIQHCPSLAGQAELYQLNLDDALATTDFNNDGLFDLSQSIGNLMSDLPSPLISTNQQVQFLFQTDKKLSLIKPVKSGKKIPKTISTYWYQETGQ